MNPENDSAYKPLKEELLANRQKRMARIGTKLK
jgi:hypothetical protein